MKKLVLAILILIIIPSLLSAYHEETISVSDFGAVGDGIFDDTTAFRKAITVSREKRQPVFLPRGIYRVTDTLVLEEQCMKGGETGAWNADTCPMARIFVDHEKGPGLHMKKSSSLYGIAIQYDETKFDTHFPPAILLDGVGINIQNLRLQYCWDGIACHPKNGAGRVNIENVFIVSCGGCGVFISGTLDLPTLRNIEVWNNKHRPDVTAFRFGYNDGISCWRLFSMSCHTGFQAVDAPPEWRNHKTGSWGTFTDCATDATSVSWDIRGSAVQQIGLTGGLYRGHHKFLRCENPNASVTVSGCQLQDNGASAVDLIDAGDITLTGCRFIRGMDCKYPYINADKAAAVNISGCTFGERSPILSIGSGVRQLSFTGNIIKPSAYPFLLSDKHEQNAGITISGNTGIDE